MKKTILNGLGKMGTQVYYQSKLSKIIDIFATVDPSNPDAQYSELTDGLIKDSEMIIDFSSGNELVALVERISKINPDLKIVTGVSGWSNQENEIKKLVKENNLTFLYGANFSIPTALFTLCTGYMAKLLSSFTELDFDSAVLDIHHKQKKDPVSGTAVSLGKEILKNTSNKDGLFEGSAENIGQTNKIQIIGLRVGFNSGEHYVYFDSQDDLITLHQQSRSRNSYAEGAILSAEWLLEKNLKGYYIFLDYINEKLTKNK